MRERVSSLQSRQPTCTELSSGLKSITLMISIDQDEEIVSQDASRQQNMMAMNVSLHVEYVFRYSVGGL